MWRRTVFQGVEQEAELLLLLFGADAENIEHALLHVLAVDTDGTATQLGAVEHHVVGTGQCRLRIGLELFRAALGCREGVMQCSQAAVVVFLEHREVDYPQRRPLTGQQLQVVAQFDAQGAQRLGDDLSLVRTEEHDIAIHCTNPVKNDIQIVLRNELDDRRLQTFDTLGPLVDLDIGQTLGAVDADILGVIVDLLARHGRTTRHTQRGNAAFRVAGRAAEHLEVDLGQLVGHINQFQRVTKIGLVRAVTAHGLVPAHVREVGQIHVQHFLEQTADHALGQAHDVAFIEEAGLDIDLGEFRLAVGTQVFVTEALGNLVIAVEARHHQQLFEQLR